MASADAVSVNAAAANAAGAAAAEIITRPIISAEIDEIIRAGQLPRGMTARNVMIRAQVGEPIENIRRNLVQRRAANLAAPAAPPAAPVIDVPLPEIIARTASEPTIVNPASKFVVVTYWWGNGVFNNNTARPCLEFYETLLMFPFNVAKQTFRLPPEKLKILKSKTLVALWFRKNTEISKFYKEQTEKYIRESGKPLDQRDTYLAKIYRIIGVCFNSNTNILTELLTVIYEQGMLRERIQEMTDAGEDITAMGEQTEALINRYKRANGALKTAIRPFIAHLQRELRYHPAIRFNEMIANWRTKCETNGCNHFAVEYPEFTQPGGYQKAINAKPLFIQKALELCAPRAVLYIDGDMTINHYPRIFDADDVDFMARGWHIDPRSSWKHERGEITVDPYTFETSGGIMYFSQSPESQRLLQEWVTETARPSQAGKADDRIISLIFNTKRLLAPMKIIQLPIEYLWLSMDYDWSIKEENMDREKIYVEHPECLTSEDTAAGGGASSDRTPKYYSGIETTYPRSQRLYESVMFPNRETAEQFRPWLNYVGSVKYLRDKVPDEELVDEHPFYVYRFGDFGVDRNTIFRRNIESVRTTENIAIAANREENQIVLDETTLTIPNIIKQLNFGRTVIYLPTTAKPQLVAALNALISDPSKNRIEFVFTDTNKNFNEETIFQYEIDLEQPMLIRPTNPHLVLMFMLLENKTEIKNVLKNSYQFLSRIRCHVLKSVRGMVGGGEGNTNSNNRNTDDATDFLYGPIVGGRRKKTRRIRKARKQTRRLR